MRRGRLEEKRSGREEERGDRYAASSVFLFGVILSLLLALSGCGPNASIANSGKSGSPTPVSNDKTASSFEKDLETMRTANFEYIFSLRRKDGGVLDAEDKKFIRENKPAEINRIVLTDDDKALIAGSNYPFSQEGLKALQTKYDFHDFSTKPIIPVNSNTNANVNR